MTIRPVHAFALAFLALGVTACAPAMVGGAGTMTPAPAAYDAQAFGWSTRSGQASIEGRVSYRRDGVAYGCTGSVALTPDTPYTRNRFYTLYGSTESAAVPEAVVRARTVPDPNADYRSFVRSSTCTDGRFSFTGLPDGGWFLIAPVSSGGDRTVLMRRIETRGGRMVTVNL